MMALPPVHRSETQYHFRDLLAGTTTTFLLRVLAVGLGVAFNILLARTLGADEAGLYLLAFNFTSILAVAGRLGLDHVVVRTVAAQRADDDGAGVRGTMIKSSRLTILGAGLLSVVTWFTAPFWVTAVFDLPGLEAPLRVLALMILPVALSDLWSEGLRGLARIRESQWIQFVSTRLLTLVGLIAAGGAWGALGVGWVTCAAASVTAATAGWLWVRDTSAYARPNRASPHIRLQGGATLFTTNVVSMVTDRMSLFFLGVLSGSAAAGIFGTALRTAGLMTLVLQALDSASAPKFATLHRLGERVSMDILARMATRVITWLTIPALLFMIALREPIMRLFGEEFVVGAAALAILAIGQAAYAITGPAATLLVMSGHEGIRCRIVLLAAVLSGVLNATLIPTWGLAGAALATALTWVVQNVLEVVGVRRILKIRLISNPFTFR